MQEREAVQRGLTEKPLGQVYWMPGASDAYVATFRGWLDRVAGGGPFGPQNEAWLAAAGPRLTVPELLNHYTSHTANCSICKTALARIKVVRAVSAAVALLGAVTAAAAAVTQMIILRESATTAAAAASSGGLLKSLMSSAAGPFILGGLAAAIVAGFVWRWCAKTIPRFYKGEHPPARNRVAGEWTP